MTKKEKSLTYKDTGVDINTGNEFIKKLPSIVNSTCDKNVINGIGDFAALYSLENEQLSNPLLVSACDGVGTKIKLAIDTNNYSGIGQDLVAMNINDLICTGAKPLFFLDYLSMSKLNIEEHSKVIESIALACKKAKVSLIGGETAEMPGIYSKNDFDLAGFAVGIVDRLKKLPKEILKEAKRLLPNSNYVGFSITQGNEYRKKSWSIYKFTSLANKILSKNKVPVFFIEKNKIDLIEKIKNQVPSAIFPELNSNLSCPALVTALASRLNIAVSIDNGVMHMMSLANIPMIVLFGPTNSKKFAPKNKFTKVLDSKIIHNTKDINSIDVDEVLSLI